MGGGQNRLQLASLSPMAWGLRPTFMVRSKKTTILTNNFPGPTVPSGLTVTGSSVLNYQTQIDWFGTVRGRIGYLWGNGMC
jgi:hypothetical protein